MIDRSLNYGRHIIERYLKLSGHYQSIVDIGAGAGSDLMIARKINPNSDLHAIESYPEHIHELAKKNINVHALNIEQDVLPFADDSVDVVIANQIIEHVKEIFWVFHEMTRILSVHGKIILGVPNLAAFHNRILLAFGKQPTPIRSGSAHIRGFTKGDILRFLHNCFPDGYALRKFSGSNFYPFPPVIAKTLAEFFPLSHGEYSFFLRRKKSIQMNS